ncbi:MAG: hypothetical protein KJ023_00185 [Burkholderiaceae bacterium]|nr:hypothetical protein [Burkholderiaceae bacterium]
MRTVADAARRDAAAERRAQWEREDGIPDRGPDDCRTPIALDLSAAGGPRLTLHPVRGRIAWRAWDDERQAVTYRGSLKQLLHALADDLPRQLGARSFL